MHTKNLFWFRRDLRLDDNTALFHALQSEHPVIPIFIFDTKILNQLPPDDARVTWIYELIEKINSTLQQQGKSLAMFYGEPKIILHQLISKNRIEQVFINHDYEPYACERDQLINQFLSSKAITLNSYKDHVIFEKDEITKDDCTPYIMYTPFSKKWKASFQKVGIKHLQSENLLNNIANHNYPFLSLKDIGFVPSKIKVKPFDLSDDLINRYQERRDFPSLAKTSIIGPYLRFGALSIRKVVAKATHKEETFLNELIWREFFTQILWHFPSSTTRDFKPKYEAIQWDNDEEKFQSWCDGKTGYPLVDAGMRELNTTGYMHNRVRMITASFLCKHLLIDWRWGEAYFASKLLDYEQASNVGNWQWVAGCGVDAAPYFRIFNPNTQLQKFDKQLAYIKKWVPELNDNSYPKPIVNHEEARAKCLRVYKSAIGLS